MVAKPLCPLYKYIIKPLDRAYYPELRYINRLSIKWNAPISIMIIPINDKATIT